MSEEQPETQRAAMKVFDRMVDQGCSLRDCIAAVYLAGLSKGAAAPKRKREPAEPKEKPTVPVWDAYSAAYMARYRVQPVRNAAVNGQLAQFVSRVPLDEAPAVAAFYVTHGGGLYVSAKHPINLLLRDAERLRTDWATNQRQDPARNQQATETAFQRTRRESVERMTGGMVSKRAPSAEIPMEAFNVLPDTTRRVG